MPTLDSTVILPGAFLAPLPVRPPSLSVAFLADAFLAAAVLAFLFFASASSCVVRYHNNIFGEGNRRSFLRHHGQTDGQTDREKKSGRRGGGSF